MRENVELGMGKRILQIAQISFLLVMAVFYAIYGIIFLLSGIGFLSGIEGLEILTFSNRTLSMTFLAVTDTILGIVSIIAAGILSTLGLSQIQVAYRSIKI